MSRTISFSSLQCDWNHFDVCTDDLTDISFAKCTCDLIEVSLTNVSTMCWRYYDMTTNLETKVLSKSDIITRDSRCFQRASIFVWNVNRILDSILVRLSESKFCWLDKRQSTETFFFSEATRTISTWQENRIFKYIYLILDRSNFATPFFFTRSSDFLHNFTHFLRDSEFGSRDRFLSDSPVSMFSTYISLRKFFTTISLVFLIPSSKKKRTSCWLWARCWCDEVED